MFERILFGGQVTLLLVVAFVICFLPVIVAFVDDHFNYTSQRRQMTIMAVGYLLMSIAFFAITAPVHS